MMGERGEKECAGWWSGNIEIRNNGKRPKKKFRGVLVGGKEGRGSATHRTHRAVAQRTLGAVEPKARERTLWAKFFEPGRWGSLMANGEFLLAQI